MEYVNLKSLIEQLTRDNGRKGTKLNDCHTKIIYNPYHTENGTSDKSVKFLQGQLWGITRTTVFDLPHIFVP